MDEPVLTVLQRVAALHGLTPAQLDTAMVAYRRRLRGWMRARRDRQLVQLNDQGLTLSVVAQLSGLSRSRVALRLAQLQARHSDQVEHRS
jgi:hypothetical protein